jgi:predicted nucleic acid-binding Zn ribbon protein
MMAVPENKGGLVLSPEQAKRRRQRNVALAIVLVLLVVLFYVVTFVKGPGVMSRGI